MKVVAALPWLVVPIVLFSLLFWAMRIVSRTKTPILKTSARAGFWGGLIICVIFTVSRLGDIQGISFSFSAVPGVDVFNLTLGIVIGFFVILLFGMLIPTRMVGIITMLLVGASSTALVAFVLLSASRFSVLYLALGTALGVLLHAMTMPATFRKAWYAD